MGIGAVLGSATPFFYGGVATHMNNKDEMFESVKEKEPRAWDKNHNRILGVMTIPISSRESIGVGAFYSNESTEEDPIITVDAGPNEKYDIHVKEVDPANATQFEMFALSCYLDEQGITERCSFGSFNRMRNATMSSSGYLDMTDPEQTGKKINWLDMLKEATDAYFGNSETYAEGLESKKLMEMLQEWKEKVVDKILNGETEEKIQIGALSLTDSEWNEMIEEYDKAQDELREEMREEIAERVEEAAEKTHEKTEENTSISKFQEVQLTYTTQVGTSQVNGVTECASVEEDDNNEKVWTITAFTEHGIICKKTQGGKEISSWEITYKSSGDAQRVWEFINAFDKEADVRFAGSKEFWEAFLTENLDSKSIFAEHEEVLVNASEYASPFVKKAWVDAAKATGYLEGGKMNYISKLLIRQVTNRENGVEDYQNVFGSSVESALQAAKEILYDLENPLTSYVHSESVRMSREQEKEFYKKFFENLQEISGILIGDESNMNIDRGKAIKYGSQLKPVED